MKITISHYVPGENTVSVKFEHEGVAHRREVNICRDGDGAYNAEHTAARVDEVARGVAYKIQAGVITNPDPAETPAG